MKLIAALAVLSTMSLNAASIDMKDPRRVVGREDDVRIDAQMLEETVSPGGPIAITWQIENFTANAVAVSPKVCDATYDEETRTITVSIGSEVPADGQMPQVTTIAPGEKKTFKAATTARFHAGGINTPFSRTPRFVQIKVNILRNIAPFTALIAQQASRVRQALSDEQFESWLESNDAIFLNAVPVRYQPRGKSPLGDIESNAPGRMF